MKALIQSGYGPSRGYEVQQIDRPVPQADEVLVRVRAASLHPDIWHVLTGQPYVLRFMGSGWPRPNRRVPGTDMAGVVEAVGAQVTAFAPGDAVFGETVPKHPWTNGGTFAEYVTVKADQLARKPENVSFEEAAAVATSGIIALGSLWSAGDLRPGAKVLVNGAAGGVGSLAVQIAKAWGAQVTGVDRSECLARLLEMGADEVMDCAEDFTRSGKAFDLILDIPGNHGFRACRRVLRAEGIYVLVGHSHYDAAWSFLGLIPKALGLTAMGWFTRQLPRPSLSLYDRPRALAELARLMESGALRPLLHRSFPLEAWPEALELLTSGRAEGRLVFRP